MSNPRNTNDYERLKAELRRLKRTGAPWYFESALHQRLHGIRPRRRRLLPIQPGPVLAISAITLALIGLAACLVMMNSNLFLHPAASGGASGAPVDSLTHGGGRSVPAVSIQTAQPLQLRIEKTEEASPAPAGGSPPHPGALAQGDSTTMRGARRALPAAVDTSRGRVLEKRDRRHQKDTVRLRADSAAGGQ